MVYIEFNCSLSTSNDVLLKISFHSLRLSSCEILASAMRASRSNRKATAMER